MGEYADDQYRAEVRTKFGFDPDSMYESEGVRPPLLNCKTCGRGFRSHQAVAAHTRDKHSRKD